MTQTVGKKYHVLGLEESVLSKLRQEVAGPQARQFQLYSCLHFLGQEKGELQVTYLQPASCLLFHRELTAETQGK